MSLGQIEHIKNIEVITQIISKFDSIDIWLAFGDHIYDRKYLPVCFKDIYNQLFQKNINWFATGVNKSGSPKHPLYQKKTSALISFDIMNYIKTL